MEEKTSLARKNGKKDEQTLQLLIQLIAVRKQNVSEYKLFTLNGFNLVSRLAI